MPRRDDEFEDDDRPRRRSRDEDLERPQRRRFEDDDDDRAPPRRKKSGTSLGLILGIVAGVLFLFCGGGIVLAIIFFGRVGDAADRTSSSNNLKQIGLACQNYQSVNGHLPNNTYGPDGKPLLSWRVHILPYIEEEGLYRQFRLNEPWDSPNNRPLLQRMPRVYATPAQRSGKDSMGTMTYYRGFSNPGTIFARRDGPKFGRRGLMIGDISDGSTNTILAIEAGQPIEWTKPDDLDASPGKPFPAMGGVRPDSDVFVAVMVDGSIRMIKRNTAESQLRAMTTYAGNETIILD